MKVPHFKELVLLGGGHSHLEVLRSFGMRPLEGVRVTLITRDVHTPYSGMLPGFISGFYSHDDCHVDLSKLATFAKARLVNAEALAIKPKERRVLLHGRPSIPYDVLSVNIGITPAKSSVPGAAEFTIPVKPINRFVQRFEALLERYHKSSSGLSVAVVGGGPGGVEVALAVHYRLMREQHGRGKQPTVRLVSRGPILASHPQYARRAALQAARSAGVEVYEGSGVQQVREKELELEDGTCHAFDECLWCTQASAAAWLEETGLPVDMQGFLAVNEFLQSHEGPAEVFAAGDVASSVKYPHAKAGVYAVRQGPVLARNLRAFLTGQQLTLYRPQSTYLSLMTTGKKHCIAAKGWLATQGSWLWAVKDNIDRKFIRKYSVDLPDMLAPGMHSSRGKPEQHMMAVPAGLSNVDLALLDQSKMRCGGCGSKVGASVLSRVLASLPPQPASELLASGLNEPDDAAVLRPPPPGTLTVQTTDFFRSNYDDPYVFGAIAANHALGDCFAMGATPSVALALAVVPIGQESSMQDDLTQMMAGACRVLHEAGCVLAGGHTSEGDDMALGFTITGTVAENEILCKGGLCKGDSLVLTKPLGSGTIMAASMQRKGQGRWMLAALQHMQQSSQAAAWCLRDFGASGCTDVTGFGLLGHLAELAKASKVRVQLDLSRLPVMDGALDCIQQGVTSSLAQQNARVHRVVGGLAPHTGHPLTALAIDPQTAGGLLAGVPAQRAEGCVARLKELGYGHAAVVGSVLEELEAGNMPEILIQVV